MYKEVVDKIRSIFNTKEFIPLHVPIFKGNEKKYLENCIDSTYVSSVGEYVDELELKLAEKLGVASVVAVANGSCGLHLCLHALQANGGEVITQAMSFVSTANSIIHAGASPVFIDVDIETMGMSPDAFLQFLEKNAFLEEGICKNRVTGKKIVACLPMHTFGHPCRIDEIAAICKNWNIILIEDAAEAIGSFYKGKSCGSFGQMGVFSFNGNKTITSGGGGAIACNDQAFAKHLKHLSTQAKVSHPWEFKHDFIGFNYRMPNINAALALAQLEQLDSFIERKRKLAETYQKELAGLKFQLISEPANSQSNYWLNCLLFENEKEKIEFLKFSNQNGVMTRPVWQLLNTLPIYSQYQTDSLKNSQYLAGRLVNIPSTAIEL